MVILKLFNLLLWTYFARTLTEFGVDTRGEVAELVICIAIDNLSSVNSVSSFCYRVICLSGASELC